MIMLLSEYLNFDTHFIVTL